MKLFINTVLWVADYRLSVIGYPMLVFLIILFGFVKLHGNVDDTTYFKMPSVSIIEDRPTAIEFTPGTVHILDKSLIQLTRGLNGTQVLETVPGLNVVDEEGIGLRMNLSIRGLDPDRSRSILVLEDGMPTALAPYGEPEMYYTPLMDRMSSVEIVKGSGSIVYGPQTIGGVINYLTNEPKDCTGLGLKVTGGSGTYLNSKISYGSSGSNVGLLFEYNRKQGDNIGITKFEVNDVMLKFNVAFSSKSSLKFKFGVYDETSNSTYVGITQNMYDNGDYFKHVSPDDKLDIRRYSANLTHQYILGNNSILITNFYGYTTTRNWKRQDFSYNTDINNSKPSNWTGQVWGDTNITNGAIYMRNSTGNRDRQFEVMGVQPQIFHNFEIAGFNNELTTGIRLHYERAFEQTINGKIANALKGELVADEVRTGYAGSAFLQNRFYITEKLILTPGLRFEQFNYDRQINRNASKDTLILGNSSVSAFIPGVGLNYNILNGLGIFTGIHKGFAPPRTKDAISNTGEAILLDAELSWNTELGIRANIDQFVNFEITGYQLNFSNQIIPISESSGGPGTDAGYVNGGATLHYGIETSVGLNISKLIDTDYLININSSMNLGRSTYDSDRFITVANNEKINVRGNKLPYAPDFSISSSLLLAAPFGSSIYISAKYLGEQFTDELNTVESSANGRAGLIDSRILFNLTIEHQLINHGITLFMSIKNLFDERYISSRRPQGIKVGLPSLLIAGIDFRI